MKTLLASAALFTTLNLSAAVTSNTLSFWTVGTREPDKQVWINDTGRVGDGTLAAGSGYQVALYWGPLGAPAHALSQIGDPAGLQTERFAGTFFGGGRTIINPVGTSHGETLTCQVKGWSYISGVSNTYEAALAAGLAGNSAAQVGLSAVFTVDTRDPFNPFDLQPNLLDPRSTFQGFAITPVPEPYTITLALLGAGALLLLRRRK